MDKDPEAKGVRDAILGIANEIWKLDENKMKEYNNKTRIHNVLNSERVFAHWL